MVLERNEGAVGPRERQNQFFVERLDEARVDHRGVDAVNGQLLGGLQTEGDLRADAKDGDVRAVAQNFSLADVEQLDLFVHRYAQTVASRVADRRRAVEIDGGLQHVTQLV